MISVAAGAQFEAVTDKWPTGLAGTLGVRIRDNAGNDALARTVAGIVEDIAGSGIYRKADLVAPALNGQYTIVWDDAAGRYAAEDLVVSGAPAQPFQANPQLRWDALVDLPSAAAYIDIPVPAAGSQDETNLYRLVNGVSRSIRRFCERQFTPERGPGGVYSPAALSTDALVLGHVRTFDYDGGAMVKLRPFEPRNITAVDLLAAGSQGGTPQALTSDVDYVAMPRDRTDDGTFLWLAVRDVGNASLAQIMSASVGDIPRRGFPSWPGGYALRVTGDWGMAAIPDDVATACLVTIAEEWRNPEGAAQRDVGDITFVEETARDIGGSGAWSTPFPPRAVALLAPYTRGPEL